ncbi:MAG TPA: universal stress protein [Candidatus Solibacter sp.]|nr:universal stress protein [Candidatus Solibacter sp.]
MAIIEEHNAAVAERVVPLQVKNVLFATDFSATSEAALPYAAAISRHFGSTLHLAHVLSDTAILMMTGGVDYVSMGTLYDDAHAEAKEKLDALAARLEGVPQRNYVRHGAIWKNLAIIVEENKIDLIVLGTHGRTGLGKLLLGSVAEDILRHAPCPVLTVGPNISGRDRLPLLTQNTRDLAPLDLDLRHIVLATDFAAHAPDLARTACSLAAEFHARLTLLHVIEDYSHLGRQPEEIIEARARLRALIPDGCTLQSEPETLLEFGPPREEILKVAAEREADLIVLGARPKEEVGTTHLPWSTTHHVVASARCPVLTLRV